jgi:hypothetical protein
MKPAVFHEAVVRLIDTALAVLPPAMRRPLRHRIASVTYAVHALVKMTYLHALSFAGRHIIVVFAPSGRRRYLRHLLHHQIYGVLDAERIPFLSLLLLALLHRKNVAVVVSDRFGWLADLSLPRRGLSSRVLLLAWHDEPEVQELHTDYESFRIASFFPAPSVDEDAIDIARLHFGVSRQATSETLGFAKTIVYVGQADPDTYAGDSDVTAFVPATHDFVASNFKTISYPAFFRRSMPIFTSDRHINYKIRNMAINVYRQLILQGLRDVFGPKLVLIGDHLEGISGTSQSILDEHRISQLYRASRVCLDLGSQYGTAWLYPRSAEILANNPGSLVQPRLDGNGRLFSGALSFRVFACFDQLTEACSRLLDMDDTAYADQSRFTVAKLGEVNRDSLLANRRVLFENGL